MDNADRLYDVKITKAAWEQMLGHARFLAHVSADAANRLVDEFLEKTSTLRQMPERCPWLAHETILHQKYRKVFFGKFHVALFEVRGSTVFIVAVVDCRQDYGWLL
ncbi:MAG: type II toxin-antitoxin system RelE/ParE family toxin [Dehalococcoidia bacterium]|nr:type II toxin-antitoxin system RelE/ParE family toxin [Dehalococcoidia bacterium]